MPQELDEAAVRAVLEDARNTVDDLVRRLAKVGLEADHVAVVLDIAQYSTLIAAPEGHEECIARIFRAMADDLDAGKAEPDSSLKP